MLLLLPFDCHNHIHMGTTNVLQSIICRSDELLSTTSSNNIPIQHKQQLEQNDDNDNTELYQKPKVLLQGMAVMSTNPKDWDTVKQVTNDLQQVSSDLSTSIIPCFGIHPWWLHELNNDDWTMIPTSTTTNMDDEHMNNSNHLVPKWVIELEKVLLSVPNSMVGETGLDGFHYKPIDVIVNDNDKDNNDDNNNKKQIIKELSCSIEQQVIAFKYHMILAYKLNRSISIHTVQCFGPLLTVLQELKVQQQLPSKIYFHAFGGKIGTVDQILSICEGSRQSNKNKNKNSSNKNQQQQQNTASTVYFGFAPIVNFRSNKTKDVIQHIGLHRIVLETDHEESIHVQNDIQQCIQYLMNIFNVSEQHIINITTINAFHLYNIKNNIYNNNDNDITYQTTSTTTTT